MRTPCRSEAGGAAIFVMVPIDKHAFLPGTDRSRNNLVKPRLEKAALKHFENCLRVAHLSLRLEAYTRFSRDDMTAIRRLAERGTREVPARRDLIREGDRARSVFLVLDGWACRYKTLPDGRRQIVGFFIPGDLCDL